MMKKVIPSILAVVLVAISLLAVPVHKVDAQAGLVSSMLNRMDRAKQSLRSLRANISMSKYNSQLRDSDDYSGIVLYIPGAAGSSSAFVRLEWTKPQHEILAVASGNYTLYRPRLNQAIEGRTGSIKSGKDGDV